MKDPSAAAPQVIIVTNAQSPWAEISGNALLPYCTLLADYVR